MQRFLIAGGLAAALALPLAAAEGTDPATSTPPGTTPPAGAGGAGTEEAEAKPFLGVVVRPTAEADFDGEAGLVVDRTFPRTTAEDLGLQRGDVITRFNQQAVATRESLKTILDGLKVGDTVTVGYLRDGARQSAVAELKARPTRDSVNQQLEGAQDTVSELQQERAKQLADLEQARAEEKTLAESMQELSAVLSALPERLDETAQQFKAVYPDGEFTVDIRIRISSHPGEQQAIDLSPAVRPAPTTPAPEQATAGDPADAPSQPAGKGPPAETGEDLVPPPTKVP